VSAQCRKTLCDDAVNHQWQHLMGQQLRKSADWKQLEAKPSDGTAHLLGTKTAGCAIWEGHLEIGWKHSFGGAANSPGMVWRGLGERLNQGDGL